ncbi:MAG: HAD-IIIA family hydrolase [Lysobacterales bacterium]
MKLVVLGRDGVLNDATQKDKVRNTTWKPFPGAISAIQRLNHAGYRVVVATNQQALTSGELSVEALHDVHELMLRDVHEQGGIIDGVFFASGGNAQGRGKRQPKVNLLREIEGRYDITCNKMTVIGDSREDLEASKSVGARAMLVRTGEGAQTLSELNDFDGVTTFSDLAAAAEQLCQEATVPSANV